MRIRGLVPALAVLVASCALVDADRDVEILLPLAPAHWQAAFPGLAFVICARDSRGNQTRTSAPVGPAAFIRCARCLNVPILGWPFAPGLEPGLLRPAGGFFPLALRQHEGREVLELTWENGAAALVMDRAAAAGRDLSRFNVPRLCRYLLKGGDPWALDLDTVAQKVVDGELTVWDIDPLPSRDVLVRPGDGTWFLESPFRPPIPAEAGGLRLAAVANGMHLLCSLEGQRWKLDVGGEETALVR